MRSGEPPEVLKHTRASGVYTEPPPPSSKTTCARCSAFGVVGVCLVIGGIWAGASYSTRVALCTRCAAELGDQLAGRKRRAGGRSPERRGKR